MNGKLVIIGNVGMSYAYALINQGIGIKELVLIDLNRKKVEGEVMDLNHCLAFCPSKINIRVGDYSECRDACIVSITAGINQEEGCSRMDLIKENASIVKDITAKVVKSGFKGIFLVATNPVDVMTYVVWKTSGFDHRRVIGTGTSLDTARLRYLIGEKIRINPENIHAYVIGEHGDSEFVPWSNANVGLQNIKNFLNDDSLEKLCNEVRDAAYQIIDRKGNTSYGIGVCLVKITKALVNDENAVVTISSYDEDNDIFMGLPSILNKDGVRGRIYIELSLLETAKLQNCVNLLKEARKKIK